MKIPAILLAGVCVAPALCAQQPAAAVVSLNASAISLTKPPFVGHYDLEDKPGCDAAGNIYTSPYDAALTQDKKRFIQLPIREVSPVGMPVRNFLLANAFDDGWGMGVAVDVGGSVYQAVRVRANRNEDMYVVKYAQDGSIQAKTKLETGLRRPPAVSLVAVFASGEYLLAGTTGNDDHFRTPYTAVFAQDGRLVKEIYEPEDDEASQKADLGDIDYSPQHQGNRFVSMGDVAAGSDGNAYILRNTPRGSLTLIYVVSPKGEVIRKLRIDAGDNNLVARSIRLYGERLAIGFGNRTHEGPYRIKIVDRQGNSIADFSVASPQAFVGDEGLDLACYDSRGLTLVPDTVESKAYMLQVKLP